MDYILSPITTPCGHIFCEFCLEESRVMNKECPICRRSSKMNGPCPLPLLGQLVKAYLQQSEYKDDRERYQRRLQQLAEWKERKRYSHPQFF